MRVPFFILCSLFVVIYSCKKSSLNTENSAAKGWIVIIDENNRPTKNYSGVTVSSENAGIPGINIDENGQFDFPALSHSSTSLILNFSKPGYGTVKQYYTKSLLDSFKNQLATPDNIILIPQSSVSVNSLSGIVEGNQFKMVCNVSVDQPKPNNGITFFLLKNSSQLSYSNWTGNIANSRTWTIPVTAGDNLYSFCITRTIDCDCEFLHPGDTVYLRAYGDTYSPFGNGYYYFQTGQLIFPGMNTKASSATTSFVVPQ